MDKSVVPFSTLPQEFEAQSYRAAYSDLAMMSVSQLFEHFEMYGRNEGRTATPVAHRDAFIQLFSSAPSVLEIGPFCNPALTGSNVSYFDIMGSTALTMRAREIGLRQISVPYINYVDHSGDLTVVDRKFTAVFSAHCIEHQPDLIHHLKQVENLLERDGAYFLAIPDKRYCFDHFIAESTLADVVAAHVECRRVHRLGSVIEHRALTTHNDCTRHWNGEHVDPGYEGSILARTQAAIQEYESSLGGYVDVHAWQFTPASFRCLLNQVFLLGYTKLQPVRVYDTPHGSNEFMAVLKSIN